MKKLIADLREIACLNIAYVYAFRGEKDKAFIWLNIPYEKSDGSLLEILNFPGMKIYGGDPRWNEFVRKQYLPEDNEFHFN